MGGGGGATVCLKEGKYSVHNSFEYVRVLSATHTKNLDFL